MTEENELVMTPGGSEKLLEMVRITCKNADALSGHAISRADMKDAMTPVIEYTRALEWRTVQQAKDIEILKKQIKNAPPETW